MIAIWLCACPAGPVPGSRKKKEPRTKTSSCSDGGEPGNAESTICIQDINDSLNSHYVSQLVAFFINVQAEGRGPLLEVVSLYIF